MPSCAQQADPTLARILGPRYESFKMLCLINLFAGFGGLFVLLAVQLRAHGVSFRGRFDLLALSLPMQPLGERTRAFAIGAGLILAGCGVMGMATAIQAYVWEGEAVPGQIIAGCALSFLSIECGLLILRTVIQDYRLINYGTSSPSSKPSRQLTAEQIEPIRRALDENDWVAAVARYRVAVPDASFAEPVEYVARLRESMRAQDPGKFALPPLTLATLNWKAMGNCALIEAVILGVVWFAAPPAHAVSAVSQFACTFLFGMAWMAFMRVQGFWKRILLFAPALVVLILGEALVPFLVEESSHSFLSYVFGFMYGRFLMGSGLPPPRDVSEKIQPLTWSLATLRWKAMGICLDRSRHPWRGVVRGAAILSSLSRFAVHL